MKRALLGSMVLVVGLGLSCSAEDIKSVEYYLEHKEEREAKIKECKNDMDDELLVMCGLYFNGKARAEKNGYMEKFKKDIAKEKFDFNKCESKKNSVYNCYNASKASK